MPYTSTLKPTAMIAASLTTFDTNSLDIHERNSQIDGDFFEEERPWGLRHGLQRILAGINEGLNAFSRDHDKRSLHVLHVALAEGRRQVAEERRAARRATREARALFAQEERALRTARRQGLLIQQLD